jgi:two-component system, cell cycle sensor histidine kinase and response regulator CckA
MNVLIVDDIAENIDLLQALLEGAGYGVVPARNGKEALTRLEEGSFALIISDILMPVMDGFQFCRECNTNPQWQTIPFIIYTATYTEKKDEEFALALGADRFVIKPQDPEKLLKIIQEVIKQPPRLTVELNMAVPLLEEKTYLSLYNERVVRKLEKKVADLSKINLALRESEALFKAIFHNHTAIKFLIDPESGSIIDANDAAATFYGWQREQLLKMKIQDINTLPPEEINKKIQLVRSRKQVHFEFQHRLADGSLRDVEVFSSSINIKGKHLLHSIVHDITKRKQVEAQRDRLIKAIEQSGETIVVTDHLGIVKYVNPFFETLTGYAREEVLGKTLRILKSGKQDQAFYRDLWQTITSGRTWHGRMVNRRKDGTLFTEEVTISPVTDETKQIVNYVAVKRDITEHLRDSEEKALLTEQLRQAQKLESVGRLAGGVAHDFNNMLSIILGYGENVLHELSPGDPLRDEVNEIVEAGKRSAALTRQLLAFSRKQNLDPDVLNINDLLLGLEKMLHRLIGEDIDIRLVLVEDLALVLIDPAQFDQIIMNLAVNARDAMPMGGKLTIETANVDIDELYAKAHIGVVPGKYVMISITDSGCGMNEKTLSQIFEPFFTTKEIGKGTGLGLATVYGIIKQSGGNIWVYSELGHGTTFKIYLPQTKEIQQAQKTLAKEAVKAGGGRLVLVVEDEVALNKLLRAILIKLGFQVFEATNGGEALLMVEEQGLKPDLLITDVIMPMMNGDVLVERLRRKQPGIKVLFMSGYSDGAIVHHGVLDPGVHFIQKPFSLNDIKAKIQTVLQEGEEV